MAGLAGIAALVLAGLASLFMAWAIGAGSSGSTPFAPAVGANAISVMRAGFVVGVLGLSGAILQGQNVSETVGGGLIGGVTITSGAAIVALLTAATIVAVGIFTGYPIATAFTVTGAVIGVGLAAGGDPVWGKYRQIGLLWTLTPVVGGGAAYATARLLRADRLPDRVVFPLLGGATGVVIALMDFAVLPGGSVGGAVSGAIPPLAAADPALARPVAVVIVATVVAAALAIAVERDPASGQRRFLLVLGGLVAFSAGGSQVGLAIGPLLPIVGSDALPLPVILAGGGMGLLLGSWTGAPRMIKALSQDYSSLGPRRSIAALIPSFAIAQTAVFFGIPVSFNEIIVSAIVGSGYAAAGSGDGGVSARKMGYTIGAWIGSLALAIGVGYGGYAAVVALADVV
jgi:PiT family inorganic phosphate transporter